GVCGGGRTAAPGALTKLIDGEALPPPMADNRPAGRHESGNWFFALFIAFMAATFMRGLFRRLPAALAGTRGGGVAGCVSSLFWGGGAAGFLGFGTGLSAAPPGRYARHHGWGGFGGGGFG